MDYRRMFDDKEHLYAYDLDGREVTVQIERVYAGELIGEKGRKSKKPMIKFVGKDKKLAINKTNGKVIAAMYGKDTDNWAGKWIAIYPTTTEFGGETVECIRVRPQVPSGKPAGGGRNASNGRGAAKGQQIEDQIRDEMAKNGAPAPSRNDDLSDEDKRAIEMAESQEEG